MVSATKKNVLCAVLIAAGLILGYVENALHFIPLYGLKIGFSNLVVLFALYQLSLPRAWAVGVVKCVLSGLLFSGVFSIAYGLAGILMSLAGMCVLKKCNAMSCVGVSMTGSCLFQVGQIAVACLVLKSAAPIYYLPYLWFGAMVCGWILGLLTDRLCKIRILK